MIEFVYDDGGRKAAGFKGDTGDCVTRSIAIATGLEYRTVYDALHYAALNNRAYMASMELRYGKNARKYASPRNGMSKKIYDPFLADLGWQWKPMMEFGKGCQVHLREDELPSGRLIVAVSKHITCVIDGVIHDLYDPSRNGTRCVYGIYAKP